MVVTVRVKMQCPYVPPLRLATAIGSVDKMVVVCVPVMISSSACAVML